MLGKQVNVLDKGWIRLVNLLPHPDSHITPELAIVHAARVSYRGESKGPEADAKLIRRLIRDGHESPLEHVVFTFAVYAPDCVWRHWMRHRLMSYNSMSGRYVELPDDEFYRPSVWRTQAKHNKQASEGALPEAIGAELSAELEALLTQTYALYQKALSLGVAREQARMFLPHLLAYYRVFVTTNLRSLINFLRLRCANDAQYEIRMYAQAIYREFVQPMLPIVCEALEEKYGAFIPGGG